MIKACARCGQTWSAPPTNTRRFCSLACRDWERFAAKMQPVPWSGCWLWIGSINGNGYGNWWLNGRLMNAHRAAYILHHGPLSDDLEIDHLCRVRLCVNPAHLEPITHAEHMGRSPAATAIHCKRGHLYSDATMRRNKYGYRQCLVCQSLQRPAWNQKRREARRANALRSD